MARILRASGWLLSLCLASPAMADEQETPDLEFLEFLAEWQDESEAWLDTQDLDKLPTQTEPAPETEVEDE